MTATNYSEESWHNSERLFLEMNNFQETIRSLKLTAASFLYHLLLRQQNESNLSPRTTTTKLQHRI